MDGGPNKKILLYASAEIVEFSLKNCKMTAYSQTNQAIAPDPDYCLVRHRCIVGLYWCACGLLRWCGLRTGSNNRSISSQGP